MVLDQPSLPFATRRAIDLIVVHCSATPSGHWLGGAAPGTRGYRTAPAVIDDWHFARGFRRAGGARSAFNWRLRAIGYHFVVDLDGRVWTGRQPDEMGAHVIGHNATSLGICLVGGAERVGRYTLAQWRGLAELLGQLEAGYAGARVCGHRDLSPDINGDGQLEPGEWLKTCPGFDVAPWRAAGMKPLVDQLCEVVA